MPQPIRPEDVLPDGVDRTTIGGREVRKGAVAAFVANVRQLDQAEPGSTDRQQIVEQLKELVPTLRAVGVLDVFQPRSAAVAEIIATA
ncbi:hypothetical protein [Amycolatopsis sp. PS_44_ISF1]|uniref:DUF7709 family protein n=1 Tax=Amycolatopsis sp. PS_44_ISF1 TaxID=2974917 RepID=UPI0028DDEE93|nr:hypothetical protein [Amycolatopsis sp. PS_44_ISF1]MDT8915514.1 hypothetical protein [Amycolatopsis sp. PS_44_ISF1]